jgi:two-component system, chemotaxis family, response regulator Rcp1
MRELEVLLVEDSRGDVLLVQEALHAYAIPHRIHLVIDGEQALDYFRRMGKSGAPPYPDVVLLDLNLPKIEGSEVLRVLRSYPECARTPAIIVSSSVSPDVREKVDTLHVDGYFRKPAELAAYLELGAMVKQVVDRASLR